MIETLGRYKILEILGQGAMGVVYKALDPMIGRLVAIKTITLSLNQDDLAEYEARFQQEIRAAGRLSHPNIVTIYDVGRTEDAAYMAMEFLEGCELKDILAEGHRIPVINALDWAAQIADGLSFAHAQNIIHRDIKPSNIMIVRDTLAKITDFGIARMPASAVKTMTGMILGSPRYMSPEQVIGKQLDHRTDIFSLGVVLYETLTGQAPFDGDNVNAIMYATVNTAATPASVHNPKVPTMLDLVVAKALSKQIDERYQSMKEFASDLREAKRQLEAASPNAEVYAKKPRATSRPATEPAAGYKQKDGDEEPIAPLKLAKNFDSFEATVKLAAMTNQIENFQTYISESRKLRAYTGEVLATPADSAAATGPSAPAALPTASPAHAANRAKKTAPHVVPPVSLPRKDSEEDSASSNLLPLTALVILALLAVALVIVLLR